MPRKKSLPSVRELAKSHSFRKRGYRYIIDFRDAEGNRIVKLYRHGEKELAEREVEKQLERLRDFGASTAALLDDAALREAAACIRRLKERGRTLTDATEHFLAYLDVEEKGWIVSTLYEQCYRAKEREGKSVRYLRDLECRLGRFEEEFGHRAADSISAGEISDWLAGLNLSPVSRNNYRRVLAVMFAFGVKRKVCRFNPARDAEKAKVIEAEPNILTPEQATDLLKHCAAKIKPVVALGLFAGLRTSELLRLDWAEIDFEEEHILVTADKAKSARRRYITMPNNLRQWLMPHASKTGAVAPSEGEYYRRLTEARREAGLLKSWEGNEMRHSFASYHLARNRNAGQTAAELGHTTPHLLFQHYRKLATPAAAEEYFAIIPPSKTD